MYEEDARIETSSDAIVSGPPNEDSLKKSSYLPLKQGDADAVDNLPRGERLRAFAALNSAALMDGCDDQLLPASFRALERELHLHPALLGQITLAQTLALSLSCPVWGVLADRYPRKHIMTFGMISWGLTTICLAFANDLIQIIWLRALNGAFLGSIGPISQSILADMTHEAKRGLQFGLLQMCQSGGRVLGGVVTTSVAALSFAGLTGWRWTFMAVGVLSLILGVFVQFCVPEFSRPRMTTNVKTAGTGEASDIRTTTTFEFISQVLEKSFTRPTMLLILAEGVIGTIPWSAMSFMTMYWQYSGFTDTESGIIASSVLFGAMIAGPIGGYIGDMIHESSPNHGRPFLGQLSMCGRVPLLLCCFMGPKRLWPALAASIGLGLFSFAGVVVNRPLMADVVRPNHRATVFALIVSVEGACAAILGAPMVGYLAEQCFGYVKTAAAVQDLSIDVRNANATALGKALLILTTIPWCCSLIIYGIIHLTYKRDKEDLMQELEGEQDGRDQRALLLRKGSTKVAGAPMMGYH